MLCGAGPAASVPATGWQFLLLSFQRLDRFLVAFDLCSREHTAEPYASHEADYYNQLAENADENQADQAAWERPAAGEEMRGYYEQRTHSHPDSKYDPCAGLAEAVEIPLLVLQCVL